MAETPFNINATGNVSEKQMDHMIGYNALSTGTNQLLDGWKSYLNYELMNGMFDLQTEQMRKYYGLQDRLVDLNESLMGSQEKVALAQLKTTEKIAEYQKDRDIAVAKSRNSAAVKIAKVNALNAQFYGQPNSLPSWS